MEFSAPLLFVLRENSEYLRELAVLGNGRRSQRGTAAQQDITAVWEHRKGPDGGCVKRGCSEGRLRAASGLFRGVSGQSLIHI